MSLVGLGDTDFGLPSRGQHSNGTLGHTHNSTTSVTSSVSPSSSVVTTASSVSYVDQGELKLSCCSHKQKRQGYKCPQDARCQRNYIFVFIKGINVLLKTSKLLNIFIGRNKKCGHQWWLVYA